MPKVPRAFRVSKSDPEMRVCASCMFAAQLRTVAIATEANFCACPNDDNLQPSPSLSEEVTGSLPLFSTGCNVRTGPTPGFQPLGELRDRPGKPKSKNGFNVHVRLTPRVWRHLTLDWRYSSAAQLVYIRSNAAMSTNQQLIQPRSTNSVGTPYA